MATAKKSMAPKKSLDDKIALAEARLAEMKSQRAERGVEASSPGVDKLLSALDEVCRLNKVKPAIVIKALARLKKAGLAIAQKPRAAYKKKPSTKTATPKAKAKETAAKKS